MHAAPAAMPSMPMDMQMAAEEIGAVRASPTTTDTTMPIGMGCSSVAVLTNAPSAVIKRFTPGPTKMPISPPAAIAANGVKTISTGVFPETNSPISAPTTALIYAPIGPPSA